LDHYASFLGQRSALREAAIWQPALVGRSLPGGAVTAGAFDELCSELLQRLREYPSLDGLWYDIHGAMTVTGLDDAEAFLLYRIREVIGARAFISTTMDLHGNVSASLAHQSDLITCYRMAPHEDVLETKERGVANLVDLLRAGNSRPIKARVSIPVLLPGEKTSTRVEPARSIYAQVTEESGGAGVLDAALWIGYAWADEPRNHAVVMVTGNDRRAVKSSAERLASAFWAQRDHFDFVAPAAPLNVCLDTALASNAQPYFISDSGDNPTAGGAGDVTWTLARLLEDTRVVSLENTVIYASLPDPGAVAVATQAGLGATVSVAVGAKLDSVHQPPVNLNGVVHSIRRGDYDAEVEVVLRVKGLYVVITQSRKAYHRELDFAALDLTPRQADIVVVKAGYLEPELFALAAGWMLALTPGGVDQDLARLGHRRIHRPMVPLDRSDFQPDLSARIIPASDEVMHESTE
jgi:microcystin degradation protein MlrC